MKSELQFGNAFRSFLFGSGRIASLALMATLVSVGPPSWGETATVPLDGSSGGVLLSISGKVEVAPAGSQGWTNAQVNQALKCGDSLRTGVGSRAKIRLSDKSVLSVNELTTLDFLAGQKDQRQSLLDFKVGSAYFFNRSKPGDVHFKTPLVSGAIRGTEFNLDVDAAGRTLVTLLDGKVDLSNPSGQATLNPGEQGVVEAGQAPEKRATACAMDVVQWCLYYPPVLNLDELGLSAEESESLSDCLAQARVGDRLAALSAYPAGRVAVSDPERLLRAELLLAAGQVRQAELVLQKVSPASPLASAVRELIAAVKNEKLAATPKPATSSGWLARSYYLKSQSKVDESLTAAREAVKQAPEFGLAWVRAAELEFGAGNFLKAGQALEVGLRFVPRHASALALKGFLLRAQGRSSEALASFDEAILRDGRLADAWLGRGLCEFMQGHDRNGLMDMQTAAAAEPNRPDLRVYLGQAWQETHQDALAEKEFRMAGQLALLNPSARLDLPLMQPPSDGRKATLAEMVGHSKGSDQVDFYRSEIMPGIALLSASPLAQFAGNQDAKVRASATNEDSCSLITANPL